MAYPMASEIAGGSAEVPDIRFEQYRDERDMPGLGYVDGILGAGPNQPTRVLNQPGYC